MVLSTRTADALLRRLERLASLQRWTKKNDTCRNQLKFSSVRHLFQIMSEIFQQDRLVCACSSRWVDQLFVNYTENAFLFGNSAEWLTVRPRSAIQHPVKRLSLFSNSWQFTSILKYVTWVRRLTFRFVWSPAERYYATENHKLRNDKVRVYYTLSKRIDEYFCIWTKIRLYWYVPWSWLVFKRLQRNIFI